MTLVTQTTVLPVVLQPMNDTTKFIEKHFGKHNSHPVKRNGTHYLSILFQNHVGKGHLEFHVNCTTVEFYNSIVEALQK
jgi:hypothetical protein